MRRVVHRLRDPQRPVLTVVVVDQEDAAALVPALDSLLAQSLTGLEVLLVRSRALESSVQRVLTADPRVRVLHSPGAGPGAARNLGAAQAVGEFLAFLDTRGVLLPDACAALVDQLVRSGSDFVTGRLLAGQDVGSARTMWPALHRHDRSCLRVIDHPELIKDSVSWNKVFRRSFWRRHQLAFDEARDIDDRAPVLGAYLAATSFDVLGRAVQLHRDPVDLPSIPASGTPALTDLVCSFARCARLLSVATPVVRDTWFGHLLGEELPRSLEAWLRTPENPDAQFRAALDELLRAVPEPLWSQVPLRGRARSWAFLHGERQLGERLFLWIQREPAGLQTTTEDGVTCFAPPFPYAESALPRWLRQVRPVDARPVVRLCESRWDRDRLTLRGSAYVLPFPEVDSHRLRAVLRWGDEHRELPVTRYSDPDLDVISGRSNGDVTASGFELVIECGELADRLPRGRHDLELRLEHRQGGMVLSSGLTEDTSALRAAPNRQRVVEDRLFRVVQHGRGRVGLEVRDAWARCVEASVDASSDEIELVVEAAASDPVGQAVIAGERRSVLAWDAAADGRMRIRVPRDQPGRLVVQHASASESDVLWGLDDGVVGGSAGAVVRAGSHSEVLLGPPRPTVHVRSVESAPTGVRVSGVSLGVTGVLRLDGPRASSTPSDRLHPGPFSVIVPPTWDPWRRGPLELPAGRYDLVCIGDADQQDAAVEEPTIQAAVSLTRTLPHHFAGIPSLSVDAGSVRGLTVEVHALPRREGAVRQQAVLRRDVYPSLRSRARRSAVLFESFRGTSGGDSPAALAEELHRRDLGLDLAWTVADGAVPVPEGTRPVRRHSAEWHALLAEAAYLVNNHNFPFFFAKAPGQTYLQTWHGTPLKRIAGDIRDQSRFPLTYLRTMEAEAAAWDHLVSPSRYCTEIFRRAFGYGGSVLEVGAPRADPLVSGGAPRRERVRARLGARPTDRVLLYAPTWRDGGPVAAAAARPLFLDPHRLVDRVPDVLLLVRGHANTVGAVRVPGGTTARVRDVTLYPDINDLFLASDILVTDYSSVMFDYAALDRPMMFFVPDLADYRETRGFYFDFERSAPGPLLEDDDALARALQEDAGAAYASARQDFRRRFAPLDDGQAAARVVDAVFAHA